MMQSLSHNSNWGTKESTCSFVYEPGFDFTVGVVCVHNKLCGLEKNLNCDAEAHTVSTMKSDFGSPYVPVSQKSLIQSS